jgi:hypothetical protein
MSSKLDEAEALNGAAMPDELVIALRRPVEISGRSFTELRLREPTAGEMRLVRAKPTLDQQIFAVALISGIPEGAVERMPISVVTAAENYLAGFLNAAPPTGGE